MRSRAVLCVLASLLVALFVSVSAAEPAPASAAPTVSLRTPKPPPGPAPVPWLALGGVAAATVSCASVVRDRRRALLGVATFSAATLGVLAARWLILPRAFFHQNGHGPLWIEHALADDPASSPYGPGFGELFGLAARAGGADPERGVFFLQALLGATVPALVFVMARALGARRWVSLALAVAIAFDPLLARLAQSESYFSTMLVLGFAAGAALAHGSRRPAPRSLCFVSAVVAAGFFVSQAARIHPLGWIALALLPCVVAVGPGGWRRRAIATAAAGAGIALIVAITSGLDLLGVLEGSLGRQWMPEASPRPFVLAQGLTPVWLLLALGAGAALRSKRGALLGLLIAVTLAAMFVSDLLAAPNPAVDGAYDRLFLPVLVGLVAAWLARAARTERREGAVASVLAVVGLGAAAAGLSSSTALPTDAQEASFAFEWRRTLPEGALVAYVERADKQIVRLPLYDGVTGARPFPLTVGDGPPPDLSNVTGTLYYYRSGLCSTEAARPSCDALQRTLALEPVASRELPARPSMRWFPYASGSVRVELSRRR